MVEVDRCKSWRYENVTSNHFTGGCGKPFGCSQSSIQKNPLCRKFNEDWFKKIKKLEIKLGLKPEAHCGESRGSYQPIKYGLSNVTAINWSTK